MAFARNHSIKFRPMNEAFKPEAFTDWMVSLGVDRGPSGELIPRVMMVADENLMRGRGYVMWSPSRSKNNDDSGYNTSYT